MAETAPRLISIDIEPGGTSRPIGSIGIAEIVGRTVASAFQVDFKSPTYDFTDVYHHTSPPPDFAECWPYVDAFIGEAPLTAYGYGYDMRALGKLLDASQTVRPEYTFIDGLTTLRRTLGARAVGDLQSVAVGKLFTKDEVRQRRMIWRQNPFACKRVVLHNAKDDALANAMVFTEIIFPKTNTDASSIASYTGAAVQRFAA